jgi:hypothetical protein
LGTASQCVLVFTCQEGLMTGPSNHNHLECLDPHPIEPSRMVTAPDVTAVTVSAGVDDGGR